MGEGKRDVKGEDCKLHWTEGAMGGRCREGGSWESCRLWLPTYWDGEIKNVGVTMTSEEQMSSGITNDTWSWSLSLKPQLCQFEQPCLSKVPNCSLSFLWMDGIVTNIFLLQCLTAWDDLWKGLGTKPSTPELFLCSSRTQRWIPSISMSSQACGEEHSVTDNERAQVTRETHR